MEHHFEKRLPASLNFVLICQQFPSSAALRLYLESKGCMVIQQDETIVGIGATAPVPSRIEVQTPTYQNAHPGARREVEIHAYLRTPLTWKTDWASSFHPKDNPRQEFASFYNKTDKDREDHLCLVFIRASCDGNISPMPNYFFEEALRHIRAAYAQHGHKTISHIDSVMDSEESKPIKDSVHLTAREHEILKWVSEGKGCWETGAILGISERTVKFHLQNIYRKLNVVNRAQAITKAMRYALI